MTYLIIGFCAYLYGYYGHFLIGPDYGTRSCLEVHYLALDR